VEAFILLLDMGFMVYLCWRIFRGGEGEDADLGYLRYGKTKQRR